MTKVEVFTAYDIANIGLTIEPDLNRDDYYKTEFVKKVDYDKCKSDAIKEVIVKITKIGIALNAMEEIKELLRGDING